MNTPILLWGPPGIGKTESLGEAAKLWDCDVYVVVLSIHQPEDISGILRDTGKSYAEAIPLEWAYKVANSNRRTLLVFDEFSNTPPPMQAACLRVIQERHVGSLKLGDNVGIVAIANPVDIAANGFQLTPPMVSRFIHFNYPTPSATQWVGWLNGKENTSWYATHSEELECLLWGNIPSLERAKSLVGLYIEDNPKELYGEPSPVEPYPCPRAWFNLVKALGSLNDVTKVPQDFDVVTGTIGKAAGLRFYSWLSGITIVPAREILNDPRAAEIPKSRQSQWSTLDNLLCAVNACNEDHVVACVTYISRMPDTTAAPFLAKLVKILPKEIAGKPYIYNTLSKYQYLV